MVGNGDPLPLSSGTKVSSILLRLAAPCCIYLAFSQSLKAEEYAAPGGSSGPAFARLDGDYELASRQSYGFFYDVPSAHWELLRENYRAHENHYDPGRPLLFSPHDPGNTEWWAKSDASWYQNNYEPNFSCMHEKRVGARMNGDGPKWVCDPHRIKKLALDRKARDPDSPGCVVYSIGSNGDFNFEMGVQKELGKGTCEFHIFDPSPWEHAMPKELERAHYHQWGLKEQGSTTLPDAKYKGLHDTIKALGHENLDVIDIFKIDCEKCEWETHADWLADGVPMLQQILIEVHRVPKTANTFFDALEAGGYVRFHKEPNIQFDPACVEYAMLKVDPEFQNGKRFVMGKKKYTMIDGNLVDSE